MLPEKSHPLPGLSAAEAEAHAAGVYNPTTGRTEYPNGGWSMPDGGVDGNTWNMWLPSGSYGRGGIDTEFNGGPVFDLDTISTVAHPGGSLTGGRDCFGLLRARGDYRQLDLVLSLRPYYDVTEWLRVYGTIGAVLSRDEFELNVTMSDNDLVYRRNSDFSHWNLYGIGGLGAMLRYKDFTLAGDFLARFGDDDLTVDDRFVHGTVEHGRWMFKLTVGYEF